MLHIVSDKMHIVSTYIRIHTHEVIHGLLVKNIKLICESLEQLLYNYSYRCGSFPATECSYSTTLNLLKNKSNEIARQIVDVQFQNKLR